MALDFPLILVVLVFATGLVWAADRVLFAPGRQRSFEALCDRFPAWEEEDSPDARQFRVAAESLPRESIFVEYCKQLVDYSFLLIVSLLHVLSSDWLQEKH